MSHGDCLWELRAGVRCIACISGGWQSTGQAGGWGNEATAGFEPAHGGFADLCLTTWLRRHKGRIGHAGVDALPTRARCYGKG